MKKIVVSIIVIGMLLATSVFSASAFVVEEEYEEMHVEQYIPISGLTEYWALIVGANPFDDYVGETAIKNAIALKNLLCDYGWKENNIRLLTDKVTADDVFNELQWIEDNINPTDTLLICLNSHGGNGHFCLSGGHLNYDELDIGLDKIKAAAIGIVVSACHSGSAIPHLQQEGRVIITSAPADETSGPIIDPFATALDEFGDYCVEGGDYNGVVSMEETFNYIKHETFHNAQIQDNCTGDLHLTFQDWENGHIDQIPDYTYSSDYLQKVMIYNHTYSQHSWHVYEFEVAQSFQPSVDVLTKIRLRIGYSGNPNTSLVVSIRKELDGVDLTSEMLLPDKIQLEGRRYTTIDFPDIEVNPGDTYYIVCRTTEEEKDNDNHYWVKIRKDDCYENGMCYLREWSEDWTGEDGDDVLFATYGKNENEPPYVTRRPKGPVFVGKNTIYTYYVSTEDADGDAVYYKFDWGDGTFSDWLGPYESGETASATHSWSEDGSYHVRVKVKDGYGDENSWSSVLRVRIGNDPPDAPTISDYYYGGNMEYLFDFVSTDPDDDVLYYYVDWGDGTNSGWIGAYDSGEQATFGPTWSEETYTIKAKAKDIYGAESEWGTLSVNMPYNGNQNSQSTQQSQSQSQSQSSQQQSGQSQQSTQQSVPSNR